jgi:hypothetical protein
MQRRQGGHVYSTFFGDKSAVVHYGFHRAMTSERQCSAYLKSHDFVQDDGGKVGRVVDVVSVSEPKIVVDKDDLGLDGSLCSSDSLSDGWIGRLGDDLGLSVMNPVLMGAYLLEIPLSRVTFRTVGLGTNLKWQRGQSHLDGQHQVLKTAAMEISLVAQAVGRMWWQNCHT